MAQENAEENDGWEKINDSIDTDSIWNPLENPEIEGVYKTMKENVGEYNSALYAIETADGVIGVWGSTVLDGKFAEVALGTRVKIVYLGMATPQKGGSEYKNFDVYVKKAD